MIVVQSLPICVPSACAVYTVPLSPTIVAVAQVIGIHRRFIFAPLLGVHVNTFLLETWPR